MLEAARGPGKARTPLHVLTGFLGSGKTALLRALLARAGADVAVLVNEVGELGLDHHLLERIDEDVLLLPGGCVCCEVRGELHAALERVLARGPARVVLETTGLADPAPLLHGVGSDPRLAARLELGGVIAVVDCLRVEELLRTQPEVRRQLEFADRVVLSKADLAPQRVAGVRAWLEREVPGREVRVAEHGALDPAWLLERPGFGRGAGAAGADEGAGALGWLRGRPAPDPQAEPDSAHRSFTTHSLRHPAPIDIDALQLWLRLVTQLDGQRLLRIKALARCRATGAAFALQAAGHAVSPPQRLGVTPPTLCGAEVVVIERGMPERTMPPLLASLRAALDAAPRA